MPKTFLAVNLSDAFTFQEKERQNSDADCLDKDNANEETDGLEMKAVGSSKKVDHGDDAEAAKTVIDEQPLPPPVATLNTASMPPAANAPEITAPESETC